MRRVGRSLAGGAGSGEVQAGERRVVGGGPRYGVPQQPPFPYTTPKDVLNTPRKDGKPITGREGMEE